MKKITCAVLTVLSTCAFINVTYADDDGFGFDDLEAVEASEQQTLLQMAKEAANNYDFSKAQSLIEQAQNKTYAPDDVENAKQVLASAKDKKQREDAEKARLAEEKRQRELVAQRQQQQQSSGGGSSSGGTVDYLVISADCYGICTADKIQISGGSGYIPNDTSTSGSVNVMKSGGSLAGTYYYSVLLDTGAQKVCNGSFYTDGRKQWIKIRLHWSDCRADIYQN